jgi:phage regulator Rha-like protein
MLQTRALVIVAKGERRIDSRLVANGIDIQHDNLMQTIRKYQLGLEKYGTLLFETGTSKHRTGASKFTYALLNKEQFGYLLMFVRVTDQVRIYREEVYDKFLEYERRAQELPAIPAINTVWEQRLRLFNQHTRIPDGYWCIFNEIAAHCWAEEFRNIHLHERATPDISVALRWMREVKRLGLDTSLLRKYPHQYPDRRGTRHAYIYPNAWLGLFRTWFYGHYLRYDFPVYLRSHTIALPEADTPVLALLVPQAGELMLVK